MKALGQGYEQLHILKAFEGLECHPQLLWSRAHSNWMSLKDLVEEHYIRIWVERHLVQAHYQCNMTVAGWGSVLNDVSEPRTLSINSSLTHGATRSHGCSHCYSRSRIRTDLSKLGSQLKYWEFAVLSNLLQSTYGNLKSLNWSFQLIGRDVLVLAILHAIQLKKSTENLNLYLTTSANWYEFLNKKADRWPLFLDKIQNFQAQ